MIRKLFTVITAISSLALLAPASGRQAQAAPQVSVTRPHPELILDIIDMELFAPNSMRVAWTISQKGLIKIKGVTT